MVSRSGDRCGRYFPFALPAEHMSEFTVTGRWQARDGWQSFEKTIDAENEGVAREHTLAEFGSRHGLERAQVEISEARRASENRTESGGEGNDA